MRTVTGLIAIALIIVLGVVGCSKDDNGTTADPTSASSESGTAAEPEAQEPTEADADVPAVRDLEGDPVPEALVEFIEGMSIPDGAVEVTDATMSQYRKVYYVVAAVADTPDGTAVLTYLHAPADQGDIGNGGTLEPLNEVAQQWAPLAGASDDAEAYEIGERLVVELP